MTPEQEHRSEINRKHREKRRDERRVLMDSLLGDHCFICKKSPKLLVAHRKDGRSHPKFQHQPTTWIENELLSGEYVRLCPICHKGVHWSMEFMGLEWEEILVGLK